MTELPHAIWPRRAQVDGATHILRKDLLAILPAVLQREPSKVEFDTFFTCATHP